MNVQWTFKGANPYGRGGTGRRGSKRVKVQWTFKEANPYGRAGTDGRGSPRVKVQWTFKGANPYGRAGTGRRGSPRVKVQWTFKEANPYGQDSKIVSCKEIWRFFEIKFHNYCDFMIFQKPTHPLTQLPPESLLDLRCYANRSVVPE